MLGHGNALVEEGILLLLLLVLWETIEAELVPVGLLSLVWGLCAAGLVCNVLLRCGVGVAEHRGCEGLLGERLLEKTFFIGHMVDLLLSSI